MFISGHVVVKRTIKEWGWFHDSNTFSVWFHLMIDANYKDTSWEGTIVKRGEIVTTLMDIAKDCGLSLQEVRTSMKKLGASGEVRSRKVGRRSIITICNYDTYQGQQQDDNTVATQLQHDSNTIATDNQHAISEEGNKEITQESKKEKIDANKELAEAADRLYKLYPSSVFRSGGNRASLKTSNDKKKLIRLLATHTEEELANTIRQYLAEDHGAYLKMFSTFLNNLPDYSDDSAGELFNAGNEQQKKQAPVSGFKISSGGLLDGIEY